MKLSVKIALMGAGCVLVTAIALVSLAVWQSRVYNRFVQTEVDLLINADLDHIARGAFHLVQTENEAVQAQVDANLNVVRHLLEQGGGARLAEESVAWRAENQFDKQTLELALPKLLIGDQWLGNSADIQATVPLVDQAAELVGGTVTLFQRMNEQGDMLRVATTVRTADNRRAIGTYIPAIQPDGIPNPVIAAILSGTTYHGRAYVVNDWYLTAYEPIRAASGQLLGMLYVGVRQQAVAERIRQAILQTSVGKTGYVYVLEGKGEHRGRYVISAQGSRDGEDVWSVQDTTGRFVIQEIIHKATALQPGELVTVRYQWQNPEEPEPRWKVARLAYYAPWDWVIGTSVYEDELQAYSSLLHAGRQQMVRVMAGAAVLITVLVTLVGALLTWSMIRPIRQMTAVAERIIEGDLSQIVESGSRDEIGILARTFNHMTSELTRYMEALREQEEEFRGIFENALEGLYQSNLEHRGCFIKANPALANILGYETPAALIAGITNIRQQFYLHPEDRDRLLKAIADHQKIAGFEVQCRRKDGRVIWVSISARLRVSSLHGQNLIEGFITDITARKQAEEELAASKDYLHEIINGLGEPLFVKDECHRWVLVNDALCAFMGHGHTELLGKSDYDYFPKEQADVFWANDQRVLDSGLININEEQFTDAQGQIHTIHTKKTLYTDSQGRRFIIGIIRDLTEQKRAEAEKLELESRLNQSQKMEAIGTMAGGIAHDFNNILQPMLSYSELLQRELAVGSPCHRYVDRIYTAGLRAKDLISQILAFSRQSERKDQPLRIQTGLKEIVKLCRSIIPTIIPITLQIDEQCAPVLLDPTQLHQIAMNLIINAYHAVDRCGGEITVGLQEIAVPAEEEFPASLLPGRFALLTITDTGCGIEPEIMEKIFEPYFTTKGQGRGTGLGLAVVYGIVKEHHGEIKVTSEVGRGTTVAVYLPVTEAAEDPLLVAQEVGYPMGSERILLIDDEELILEVEQLILEGLGYQVTTRKDCLEALALFREQPEAFDLVVTDMTMPNMTGDQLARAIRAIRGDVPIILCSGNIDRLSRERAGEQGVRFFLRKPITLLEMSHKVRAALDEASTQGQAAQEGGGRPPV